jgi:hypothetical protein
MPVTKPCNDECILRFMQLLKKGIEINVASRQPSWSDVCILHYTFPCTYFSLNDSKTNIKQRIMIDDSLSILPNVKNDKVIDIGCNQQTLSLTFLRPRVRQLMYTYLTGLIYFLKRYWSAHSQLSHKSDKCCICMDSLSTTQLLPCLHHTFCYDCIRKHQKISSRCPYCKQLIVDKFIYKQTSCMI